jgi:hypothetical protein
MLKLSPGASLLLTRHSKSSTKKCNKKGWNPEEAGDNMDELCKWY